MGTKIVFCAEGSSLAGCIHYGTGHYKWKCANLDIGLVGTQDPIEERAQGSCRYGHVLSMSVQNLGLFHFSFSFLYGAEALRRSLSCHSNNEKQTPVFHICWKAVVLQPTPHHQKLWGWRAKNLINREAGLIRTELQPAVVVPHPCVQGPGAEWALDTQCRATKCSISSAFGYLNVTLCCQSRAQSFLFGIVLFLTRQERTWTGSKSRSLRGCRKCSQSCRFRFQVPFCFAISDKIRACLGTQSKPSSLHP